MRSHKLTYSRQVALPDWLYTFQHQIASGGKDKRPDRLLPTAIIEDIAAVARGILEGHGTMRREHWDSLLEDADRCHATLGPRAKQVLQPAWAAARSEFLAARPARQAQTTMPAAQRLATAASQLRSRLADAPVRQACWDDARAAHEDETEHPETSELRIRLLGDAVTAAGHDWHRVSDILARAINDEPSALRALGWRDADRTPPNEQAGLALEDRVTICRNGLGRPAEQAELIAWVGFEDASIGAAVNLTAGAVQMWDIRELWLRYHEKRFDELPAELAGTRLSDPTVRLHDTPDTSGVLLRFPLGIGTTAHAVQRARDVGQALVALAVGSSTWRMMDGAAIVRDERIVSGQIRTSDTPAPLRDHYAQRDRTAEHLSIPRSSRKHSSGNPNSKRSPMTPRGSSRSTGSPTRRSAAPSPFACSSDGFPPPPTARGGWRAPSTGYGTSGPVNGSSRTHRTPRSRACTASRSRGIRPTSTSTSSSGAYSRT
jgi:hypothetical protein